MGLLDATIPKLEYNGTTILDISHRVRMVDWAEKYASYTYPRTISDNMTPEQVAHSVYGDTNKWWIVCLLNDVIDPFYDWLMSDDEVMAYALKIHGEEGIYEIHHWADADGEFYMEDSPENDRVPVTHIEHMYQLNEDKREIMLLRKDQVRKMEEDFKNIMKSIKPQVQE